MLSTFQTDEMVVKLRQSKSATGVKEITNLVIKQEYNQNMGGVDLSDHMIQSYGYSHRLAHNVALTDYSNTEIGC